MVQISNRQVKAAQLEAAGFKAIDIASSIGVTPQTISAYRQIEEYRVLVSKIAQSTFRASQLRLIQSSEKALETIVSSLDSQSESIRLRAAEDLLRMLGMADVVKDIGAGTIAEYQSKNSIFRTDIGMVINEHTDVDAYLDGLGV